MGTATGAPPVEPPLAGFAMGVAVALDDEPLSQPVETMPVASASSAIRITSFFEMIFNGVIFLPGD